MAKPALRPRYLAPGDKLGKFDLIRQIAVGGMAELYLARTMGIEGFEKLVVVKRILPQYVDNPTFVNMFLNEARLSATLHHPNITQVYDIGVEEGDYFFSMEYVHGEDLGRLTVTALENGVPVSLDCALTLVAGLCAGLHYAHEKAGPDGRPLNVVHRDVSPSNVLVSYDGAVKLVDFGIARAGSAPATTRGGLKGKIAYMSPEQCQGKATLDRRSDVFSIGSILYELTTGQLPFTDETEYGVLNQIVNTDARPPRELVPNYPPALEAIVVKALARHPDQRYRSALELQGQIEDFAHENRLRVSPLVLARLMSTLFPARLEEWDHARAQGAFIVEQHVLRTLIESGKTNDNSAVLAQLKQATPPPTPPVAAEDEATDVLTVRVADTSVGPAPMPASLAPASLPSTENPFDSAETLTETLAGPPVIEATTPARSPTPIPGRPTPVPRLTPVPPQRPTPVPPMRPSAGQMPLPAPRPTPMPSELPQPVASTTLPRMPTPIPGAVPIMAPQPDAVPSIAPMAAGVGTLISNRASSDAAPVEIDSPMTDLTERVRVPSPSPRRDDTAFVRPTRSRLWLILGIGGAIAAAGIAIIVIASGGGGSVPDKDAPATTTTAVKAPAPALDKAVAPAKPDEIEMTPEPVEKDPVVPKPDPTPPPEPVPAPEVKKAEPPVKAEPPRVDKKRPAIAKTPKVVKATPPVVKATPPTVKKTEPKKEPAWNAESPFMPVRTDKK